jgi:hypothetical protein
MVERIVPRVTFVAHPGLQDPDSRDSVPDFTKLETTRQGEVFDKRFAP